MKKYKFKDIFSFESKSKLKASNGLDEGLFPFYTSSLIVSKKTNNPQYESGSLIIGTGGSASVHFATEPFSTSSHCLVATIKSNLFNPKYIYYYLLGNIQILERGFKGAGLKNISQKYIEDIEVPIFTLEKQNRIVSALDKADLLVKYRKKSVELLDELLVSKFLDMFGDPISNKKSWCVKELDEIAILSRGKFTARPRNDPAYFNGDYPFIQTGDISNSNYRLYTYTQTLNDKGIKVSKKFNSGTIVIAIVGATIGATSVLMIDTYATDSVIGIEVNEGVNNIFLEMLLRFYRPVLKDKAPEGDKPNINLKILSPLKIIQPPIELQNKYAYISTEIEKLKRNLESEEKVLDELFSSIIEMAFNGQLNFDVSVEVDSIIKAISINNNKSLSSLLKDVTYLNNFVDRVNDRNFESIDLYEAAKDIAFDLLKNGDVIEQRYDEISKELRLFLK
ncbi:restriction endonuclease subunit S [Vibrio fluvialis]|uniref:restriction endonuclease subunit S n=1 Tax=Vibrio fluvialis TaxID=676 RepID=UPI0028DDDE82|nr:restriction endonuclease subunit S [Vibrio fluvialis]MDT8869930.1 restriction endonuclease subunit S [Vibrio fluvialis]MDT8877700.1 restriction endonuclease subunit S [Vibrio fluvialis]